MDVIIRISRHADKNREAAIRKCFGEDVHIITKNLEYGNSAPWRTVSEFINDQICALPTKKLVEGESIELVAVEIAGPEAKLIDIVKHCKAYRFVRPVFRRGHDGRVVVTGKDDAGRDIFDIEDYEVLGVEVRESIVGKPLT